MQCIYGQSPCLQQLAVELIISVGGSEMIPGLEVRAPINELWESGSSFLSPHVSSHKNRERVLGLLCTIEFVVLEGRRVRQV